MRVSRLSTFFFLVPENWGDQFWGTWTAVSARGSLCHNLCSFHYVSEKVLFQSKTVCAKAHSTRSESRSLASMPRLTLLTLLSGTSGSGVLVICVGQVLLCRPVPCIIHRARSCTVLYIKSRTPFRIYLWVRPNKHNKKKNWQWLI